MWGYGQETLMFKMNIEAASVAINKFQIIKLQIDFVWVDTD